MNSGPFLTGSAPSSATEVRSNTLMPYYQSLQRLGHKKTEIDYGGLAFSQTTLAQHDEHPLKGQRYNGDCIPGSAP